jgi:hypothetical protein
MVQPVPGPVPTIKDPSINLALKGRNQNLMLFSRGKHISCAPNNKGSRKFPNAPIKIGITIKKIIKKACKVTTLL